VAELCACREKIFQSFLYLLRMFFTAATNIDGPTVACEATARIRKAVVIKAKHSTNFIVNNIYQLKDVFCFGIQRIAVVRQQLLGRGRKS
jgi:hypothetical protein